MPASPWSRPARGTRRTCRRSSSALAHSASTAMSAAFSCSTFTVWAHDAATTIATTSSGNLRIWSPPTSSVTSGRNIAESYEEILISPAGRHRRSWPGPVVRHHLSHGTVIDGSGNPRFDADVGIRNGFIVAIGDLDARHRDHGNRRARAVRHARLHQHSQSRVGRCAADRGQHAHAGRDHRDLQRRRQRAARTSRSRWRRWRCPDSP